jgi:hypothetical protein
MNNEHSSEKSETDWARVAAMTDDDIDFSDLPPITEDQIRQGKLVLPGGRVVLRSTISREMDSWLDSTGEPREDIVARALDEYRQRHAQSA